MAPDAASHVPSSIVLENLLRKAPSDHVTLAWLLGELRERSFGFVMLVMALVALIPGGSTFVGFLLAYPAIQMIMARPGPTLPEFIARRRVSTARIAAVVRRTTAVLKRIERFIRPQRDGGGAQLRCLALHRACCGALPAPGLLSALSDARTACRNGDGERNLRFGSMATSLGNCLWQQ